MLTYFPVFAALTHFVNPNLERALTSTPVTVTADPAECSFQFNPVGITKFTTSGDIAKSTLVTRSVNNQNVTAPPGTIASVKLGDQQSPPTRRNCPGSWTGYCCSRLSGCRRPE